MTPISISRGNTKLGKMPNISLPPIVTCEPGAMCAKSGLCYALKSYRAYPNVRDAWSRNLSVWEEDPKSFETQLENFLTENNPEYFRWHVGGDIPDMAYAKMMLRVARNHHGINFLAYTKRRFVIESDQIAGNVPPNLALVLSSWPGQPIYNPHGLPVAYVDDGTETRIPDNAHRCEGSCANCHVCWYLHGNWSVAFPLH